VDTRAAASAFGALAFAAMTPLLLWLVGNHPAVHCYETRAAAAHAFSHLAVGVHVAAAVGVAAALAWASHVRHAGLPGHGTIAGLLAAGVFSLPPFVFLGGGLVAAAVAASGLLYPIWLAAVLGVAGLGAYGLVRGRLRLFQLAAWLALVLLVPTTFAGEYLAVNPLCLTG
jgi:hypothetical protein